MRFAHWFCGLIAALGLGGLLLACGPVHSVTVGRDDGRDHPEVHDHHHHGPPPHAPAHGHRRKHARAYHHHAREVELVFDSGLGVYVVVDLPHHYYWNGAYLRISGGRWTTSRHLDGDWKPCASRSLPKGLRAKHAKAKKGSGHGPAERHP